MIVGYKYCPAESSLHDAIFFTTFSLGFLDFVFHFSNTDFPLENQHGIYSN